MDDVSSNSDLSVLICKMRKVITPLSERFRDNSMNMNACVPSVVCKESACNAGDPGSIPESGRCSREGNGNPLQYSCLGNPVDRGTQWATVHGVTRVRHDLATKPPPLPSAEKVVNEWQLLLVSLFLSLSLPPFRPCSSLSPPSNL